MQTIRKALPFLLLLAAVLAFQGLSQQPTIRTVHAQSQPDCSYIFTFTGNSNQTGQDNRPTTHPCIAFRVTYTTTGTLTATVAFQTSPDNVTFTSVPNTICSAAVQPPCLTDGVNPTATGRTGTMAVRAYDAWTRITTASSSGAGAGTVTVYGYKGTSASANTGGSGGGSGTVTHTAGALTATAIVTGNGAGDIQTACPTCTLSASGNESIPGTLSTGVGGGASGSVTLTGSTSGSATVQAAAVQGTPNPVQLPTTTGTAGQVLSTNGANPQQLSWITGGGGSGTVNTGTAHQTAVYSSAGTAVSGAGPGTAGQVLTSNGAGADPTYQAAGAAPAPYQTTVSAQTSVSITAATHGLGTLALGSCFDNSTPRVAVACAYTRNTSGDLVFTFAPAFTGQIEVSSSGNGGGGGSQTNYPGAFAGTSATAGFGPTWAITTPPTTGWSWINQGSATIDSTGGYEYLDSVAGAGGVVNLIARVRTAPATPYTLKALILPRFENAAGTIGGFGLCFTDGTKFVTVRLNTNNISAQSDDFDKWNSATSFNADYTTVSNGNGLFVPGGATWLRIGNDGTNLSVYLSLDGQHWRQLGANQLVADFIAGGPTQIGFFVYNNSTIVNLAVLSWVLS
jgi:hypothetical protein